MSRFNNINMYDLVKISITFQSKLVLRFTTVSSCTVQLVHRKLPLDEMTKITNSISVVCSLIKTKHYYPSEL